MKSLIDLIFYAHDPHITNETPNLIKRIKFWMTFRIRGNDPYSHVSFNVFMY